MKHFFIFILIFFVRSIYAQDNDVKFYTIAEGLSQQSITSIIQDQKGFMWFGSRYGLNRYDGEHYLSYEGNFKQPQHALTNNYVNKLLEDKAGNIWIGTNGGGLNYYNYNQDAFESFINEPDNRKSLSGNMVTALFLDSEDNLWVGTEKYGLNLFDNSSRTFSRYYHNEDDPSSISHNDVMAISEDRLGNLWVGTWGGGLNLYDRQSKRFLHYRAEGKNNIPDDVVRDIHKSKSGDLWVGFQKGLRKITYKEGRYKFTEPVLLDPELANILSNVPVLAILEDDQSRLWIGTENEGLFIVNLKTGYAKQHKVDNASSYGIASNSIWSIYKDNVGTIWLGTFDKGVLKVDNYERKFDHLFQDSKATQRLSHSVVSCFVEDDKGNLWIGTDGGGLNYYEQATGNITHYNQENTPGLLSNAILSLLLDSEGNLWIGSWEGGLSIMKKGTDTIVHISNVSEFHPPPGNFIFSMYEDSNRNIWIGAYKHGLTLFVPEENMFYEFKEKGYPRAISFNNVQAVHESHGYIWIGTEGGGVDRIKLNDRHEVIELVNYSYSGQDSSQISNNFVTCIYSDAKGNLWMGTHGGGLNRYDAENDRFEFITMAEGLPSNLIYAIEDDDKGHIWISTNKGIAEYDPVSKAVNVYDEADGLQSSMFYRRSSYKKRNGELLFGGINGVTRFHPSKILRNPHVTPVYITSMMVSNAVLQPSPKGHLTENIVVAKEVNLPYFKNDFTITFSSLNFSQSSKNQYMYKLDGHDEEWQEVGTRNSAYYTNVAPGCYVFRVRASNNDNLWNENEASLIINISNPWWATIWACIFYGLVIVAVLWWGRSLTVKREKLKSKLEVEHLELKKMQEMDEMRSRFFANISHEFRTPLTLILGPLRSLYLEEKWTGHQSQIRLMIKNAEKLLRLINQLLDLSKLESGSMKLRASEYNLVKFIRPIAHSFTGYAEKEYIRYKIILPEGPIRVYFEKDKLEKVFTNILANAFKFTPRFGTITLEVVDTPQQVVVSIQDSGIGISNEEISLIFNRYYQANGEKGRQNLGTGIGLTLTKELVELHKGKIIVNSEEGKGTLFQVLLQKGSSHLQEDEIVYLDNDLISTAEMQSDLIFEPLIDSAPEKLPANHNNSLPVLLLVEDNPDIRAFVCDHLSGKFSILEAENGKEGLEIAIDQKPDVIISDIVMPEMDGYALCEQVKSNMETSHIPVILLTAKASHTSQKKGFETGADYFISKPFDVKELELRLNNILKLRDGLKDQVLNNKTVNLNPKNMVISNADDKFVKKVVALIEENIADPSYNVNDLCLGLGLSRIQLYRKLKKMVGQSANELIRSIKLKRAAQLLKQQKLTIAEITYQVGFNDLQYFRKCFKKHFGMNPSEYAAQYSQL